MDKNACSFEGRVATKPTLRLCPAENDGEICCCFFRLEVGHVVGLGERNQGTRRINLIPIASWGEAAKRHATDLDVGMQCAVEGTLVVDTHPDDDAVHSPGLWSVSVKNIRYGQLDAKALLRPLGNLDQRLNETHAGVSAGNAAGDALKRFAWPIAGSNPFTKDGRPPIT